MGSFLAVARGSANPPRLIVLRYQGDPESDSTVALVGKGITFDTGGYDIKDDESMATMKSDMGGAAAVIGALLAIARSGIKANVTAVVAACENRVSAMPTCLAMCCAPCRAKRWRSSTPMPKAA